MQNIVIIPNPTKDVGFSVTSKLIARLSELNMTVHISREYGAISDAARLYDAFPTDAELIVVVGGDGSMIDASRLAIERNIPIIGVNLGRVGYLSEVYPDELDIFERLKTGDYSVKEKMLLSICDDGSADRVYAVNDVIISRGGYLGVSEFNLCDSCGNSLNYRADGVILATPQGSTAYSFSAGGPVVAHDVEGILVTPVCPHSFFNRSVIFNSAEILTITNTGACPMSISVDGRKHRDLLPGDSCRVSCADKKNKTLTFSENSMFTELFKKMNITEGLK